MSALEAVRIATPVPPSGRPLRVLLVDDSPGERALAAEAVLEFASGFDLRCVATPAEADDAVQRFIPDVVLIDLHLAGSSGRDLLPRLGGRCRAVILSTTDDPQEALRCLAAGALGFWVKPRHYAGFANLFARIRSLVAGT